MKKILFLLSGILAFLAGTAQEVRTPGNCIGYQVKGNRVVFKGDNKSAVSLKLLANGLFQIWFSADGRFEKKNESFAVITDSIDAVGSLQIHEQAQVYELFTDQLRIRVNRSPFQVLRKNGISLKMPTARKKINMYYHNHFSKVIFFLPMQATVIGRII